MNISIRKQLTNLIRSSLIKRFGQELNLVKRQRKIKLPALVWTVIFGGLAERKQSLESLRRSYMRVTGFRIARSSFYQRFTPQLCQLLRILAENLMCEGERSASQPKHLSLYKRLKDIFIVDSTLVDLLKGLLKRYPSTHEGTAKLKLHMVINAANGSPNRVKISTGKTHDMKVWQTIGSWVSGRLLLFDLGYYSFSLFDRIERKGGFFLTRLKANSNLKILKTLRVYRGRAIDVVGKSTKDIFSSLSREVLDVEVEVSFLKRSYRGRQSTAHRTYRLIAIRRPESGRYFTYLTNLTPEILAAEGGKALYSTRWQVEIFFKSLKSYGALGNLPSEKSEVVEILIWGKILFALLSTSLLQMIRSHYSSKHFPTERWLKLCARLSSDLLYLALWKQKSLSTYVSAFLIEEGADPNIKRKTEEISCKYA